MFYSNFNEMNSSFGWFDASVGIFFITFLVQYSTEPSPLPSIGRSFEEKNVIFDRSESQDTLNNIDCADDTDFIR